MAKATSVQERLLALEDGEIQATLLQWMQTNRLVVGSIVGIFVLLAGGSLYWRYQKAIALDNLHGGIGAFQSGDSQKALSLLQQIGKSSLGNAERALGLLYVGEAQRALGKNDEAMKGYEEALDLIKRRKAETYLEQMLLVKIASLYAAKNMDAEARQRYEQAAGIEGPFRTEALASAARLAEKLNDAAAAKAHYEKLASVDLSYPLAEVFQSKAGK